jgi:hypothetical protein
VDNSGPLGTVWAGIGLACFYVALIWVNALLGHMLAPLFLIPVTWILDKFGITKKSGPAGADA